MERVSWSYTKKQTGLGEARQRRFTSTLNKGRERHTLPSVYQELLPATQRHSGSDFHREMSNQQWALFHWQSRTTPRDCQSAEEGPGIKGRKLLPCFQQLETIEGICFKTSFYYNTFKFLLFFLFFFFFLLFHFSLFILCAYFVL